MARSCRAQPRNGCARVRARAHEPTPFIYQQERAMAAPQAQVAGRPGCLRDTRCYWTFPLVPSGVRAEVIRALGHHQSHHFTQPGRSHVQVLPIVSHTHRSHRERSSVKDSKLLVQTKVETPESGSLGAESAVRTGDTVTEIVIDGRKRCTLTCVLHVGILHSPRRFQHLANKL